MARTISPSDLTDSNRLVADNMINGFRVDDKTVVKLCDPNRLTEAEALRFIRSKTSLPVPEVYNAYVDETIDRGVIVMEYIEGEVLRDVIQDMDDTRRQKIISDLQRFMCETRSIEGDFIGSIDGSACEDPVFWAEQGGFGPYKTENEFNEGLIRAMTINEENSWVGHISKLIRALPSHTTVLTYADFSPRNIIMRGERVLEYSTGRWLDFTLSTGNILRLCITRTGKAAGSRMVSWTLYLNPSTSNMLSCYICNRSSGDDF